MVVSNVDRESITHPLDIAKSAAKIGGVAGLGGITVGSIAGVLRNTTPVLFSIASGLQWTTIGFTFWSIRSSMLQRDGLYNWWSISRGLPTKPRYDLNPTPKDRVYASTVSGATTGGVLGFLFRGPRNVIPGIIMFTFFGFTGQHLYNRLDARHLDKVTAPDLTAQELEERGNWLKRFAQTKWSPMTVLSDEEYEKMLKEKLLRIETDLELVEERLVELKAKKVRRDAMQAQVQMENQERPVEK
ncbi:hypothetical protein GQ43DRAFT_381238 [Delitschia confertaspora ATCC 74209]|uniref:Uncharacterized protein n=1 Tax=Delitschia confertaspora ATCC 74209 TaxID=1513339 RepID=A0A9P4JFH6_9PLEO|nr:hypothetical protein GQ43DRAFT_381238 [Delitschia confertaspora ATCC 74209]